MPLVRYGPDMSGVAVRDSLIASYVQYAHAAAARDLPERERLWDELHRDAHPEVFDFVAQHLHEVGERGSIAGAPLQDRAAGLPEHADQLLRTGERFAASLQGLGALDTAPLPVVLLAGTTRAHAWVEYFRDEPTMMLETTLIPKSELGEVAVAHEAVHVAHLRAGGGDWPETLASEILSEGLATALSANLVPGHSPDVYLWIDHEHREWLEQCRAVLSEGLDALLSQSDATDPQVLRPFLSAGATGPWPVRFGYYLGVQIADALRTQPGGLPALLTKQWPAASAALTTAIAALQAP